LHFKSFTPHRLQGELQNVKNEFISSQDLPNRRGKWPQRFEPCMSWAALPYQEWQSTYNTFHRWLQIIGKVKTAKSPWINHSWSSPLYISSRGFTTSLIPDGARSFSIEVDLIESQLLIQTTDGKEEILSLHSETVADFYKSFLQALENLKIEVHFSAKPDETLDRIPFSEDVVHSSFDRDSVFRFWQTLVQVQEVFQEFRSRFLGKTSPVHFFWGSLDLAVTRFSGRRAPEHPAGIPNLADEIVKEAYSHEVSSAGFWPGNDLVPFPLFYSYVYPQPKDFEKAKILPEEAYFHPQLQEFVLPYEDVQKSSNPPQKLLSFLQSTYEAAANLADWDRDLLEESPFLHKLQEKHSAYLIERHYLDQRH
jgi:hypothetical protein